MKNYLLLIISATFLLISCDKDRKPVGNFVRCKVDGLSYSPDNCANCITCRILGDTTFLLGVGRGSEIVIIGIIKLDKIPITATAYILNENPQQIGSYDNTPGVPADMFKTSLTNTGNLKIGVIDKGNKKIEGTFSFQAYNPVQNKIVSITNGEFRLPYTTN